MDTECSVENCKRPVHAKGLCNTHYRRSVRRGTTEDPPPRQGSSAETMDVLRALRKPPRVNTCGHPDRKHAVRGMCHPCYMTAWNREHPDSNSGAGWYKNHPEQQVLHSRRVTLKRHGMTIEGYAAQWTAQQGKCANPRCHQEFPLLVADYRRGLQVDHDHETGEYRGLLCPGCNLALGCVRDDLERIAGLIEYLRTRSEALD